MALGETIGFSTRWAQNNSTTYDANQAMRYVHIALMGDPTLRMHVVAPASNLVAMANGFGGVDLSWSPSTDAVVGYHVYRAPTSAGPFTRLNTALIGTTNYTDAVAAANTYMVRAVKLEVSASGSYWNASQGTFAVFVPPTSLTITNLGSAGYAISGYSIPGQSNRMLFAPDLSGTTWQALGTATANPYGIFQFIDTNIAAQRFYRSVYP